MVYLAPQDSQEIFIVPRSIRGELVAATDGDARRPRRVANPLLFELLRAAKPGLFRQRLLRGHPALPEDACGECAGVCVRVQGVVVARSRAPRMAGVTVGLRGPSTLQKAWLFGRGG